MLANCSTSSSSLEACEARSITCEHIKKRLPLIRSVDLQTSIGLSICVKILWVGLLKANSCRLLVQNEEADKFWPSKPLRGDLTSSGGDFNLNSGFGGGLVPRI